MLLFEQAFATVLNSAQQLGTKRIEIADALNRILAEDWALISNEC